MLLVYNNIDFIVSPMKQFYPHTLLQLITFSFIIIFVWDDKYVNNVSFEMVIPNTNVADMWTFP